MRASLKHRSWSWRDLAAVLLFASFFTASWSFSQQVKKKGISVGEPPPDHSPEAELASFKVLDGFEVNLFASEIDGIPNPIAIRWDERGRLWVLQTSSYPQPKPEDTPNDKIIILEDIDHDGRADKRSIFAEGLCQPMGMELAPCSQALRTPNAHSVYVGEGEKLWLLHDDNGDDKVDRKEVVFSGFGTGDTHQCLNSFVWSPDGALVMHQGLHCYSKVVTPWGTKTLYGAGFWHYRPRSGKLEPYPTGMPLNPWGTVFTNEGQPIMVAGAAGMYWARPMEVSTADTEVPGNPGAKDDRLHTIPHFLIERLQLPYGGQCIKTQGLTKYCGIDLVGNAHWPEAMQGEIVVGGFFENKVFRYQLRDDPEFPSGIEAVEQPALITSDNVAFRPIDIRFGPDGACYIADWYDPIIGHYQASFRHPNRDKAHGRIWRVVAKDREKVRWLVISSESPNTDLLAGKDVRDRWAAYQLQRMVHGYRLAREAIMSVSLLRDYDISGMLEKASPEQRSEIEKHLKAEDHQFLIAYWRTLQASERMGEGTKLMASPISEMLLRCDDADLRAYITHSIGEFTDQLPGALDLLQTRTADPSPRVRLEAVVAAAKVQKPEAIKVALKVLDHPMDSYIERALWLAVQATAKFWRVGVKPSGDHPESVFSPGTPSDSDSAPLATFAHFLSDLPPAHIAFLIKHEGSAALRATAASLLQQPNLPANVRDGLTLALAKDEATGDTLNKQEKAQLNQAGKEAAKLEALALSTSGSPRLHQAALAKLAQTNPARAGLVVATALPTLQDLDAMKALLAPVLPVEAATQSLTAALKAKPCTADAAKLVMRVLTSTGRSEPELTAALTTILGTTNTVPAYDPAWVNALAAEVKATGNATKGKAVFASTLTNCTACHSIAKKGGTIGPELDAVGRGIPLELLIEAVTWPNRQIKEGYLATSIVTKDGRRLQGYKVSDANGELQLRDFLGGGISKFTAAEITSRTDAGSLMPEGLVALMTREELRDLIAYLASLGR